MTAPTAKFFGEQDDRHRGRLHWPGVNELPFRGSAPPSLRQHELENLPVVGDTYERVFDLSQDEDAAYFNWIRNRARNGLFVIDHIERHWDAENNTMRVYLEWTQLYVQQPRPQQQQHGSNGNGRPSDRYTLG